MIALSLVAVARTGRGGGPGAGGDAVAREVGGSGRRLFVPGSLACGECNLCRRGVTARCAKARVVVGSNGQPSQTGVLELPDRFVTPIDDGVTGDGSALTDRVAALAGLVAEAIDAAARAGAGPGDRALWLGEGPLRAMGEAWTRSLGCRTEDAGADEPVPALRAFVCGQRADDLAAAIDRAAVAPSWTLTFLDGMPDHVPGLGRLGGGRIVLGGGYHPDLVVDALAALRRGAVDAGPFADRVADVVC